jgi:MATE family multidrug resistance protein
VLAATFTFCVIASRFAIARSFLGEGANDAIAVIALAAQLLLIGATFFITDGLQTIAAGALRGLKDTSVPLLFAAISYWLVGFAASWALAFWTPLGAVGVWIGLSIGTAVYALLLILRFRLLAGAVR